MRNRLPAPCRLPWAAALGLLLGCRAPMFHLESALKEHRHLQACELVATAPLDERSDLEKRLRDEVQARTSGTLEIRLLRPDEVAAWLSVDEGRLASAAGSTPRVYEVVSDIEAPVPLTVRLVMLHARNRYQLAFGPLTPDRDLLRVAGVVRLGAWKSRTDLSAPAALWFSALTIPTLGLIPPMRHELVVQHPGDPLTEQDRRLIGRVRQGLARPLLASGRARWRVALPDASRHSMGSERNELVFLLEPQYGERCPPDGQSWLHRGFALRAELGSPKVEDERALLASIHALARQQERIDGLRLEVEAGRVVRVTLPRSSESSATPATKPPAQTASGSAESAGPTRR